MHQVLISYSTKDKLWADGRLCRTGVARNPLLDRAARHYAGHGVGCGYYWRD